MLITFSYNKQQSGAVLVVSLIMLLLLTIIGLNSIQTTLMEEKMSYNLRDANVSFQSAEGALLVAESDIESFSYADLINKPYAHESVESITNPTTWTSALSNCTPTTSPCLDNPRYLIMSKTVIDGGTCAAGNICTFEIYARGVGASGQGIVLLKSTYDKSY